MMPQTCHTLSASTAGSNVAAIVCSGLHVYRPGELAARAGLSKQATNAILRDLEAGGYITLVPDPDDGRARRIR